MLEFQAFDWNEHQYEDRDDYSDNSDDEEQKNKNKYCQKYLIQIFGKTSDEKTVYIEVKDFYPYFYIDIPDGHNKHDAQSFIDKIKKTVFFKQRDGLKEIQIVKKYKFKNFTNYKMFNYAKLIFKTKDAMKSYENAIRKYKETEEKEKTTKKDKEQFYNLFESNIPPITRLLHERGLDSVGYISVNKKKLKSSFLKSCNDYNYSVSYEDLVGIEKHTIEKYIICAFDIECNSVDGSFPRADRKTDEIIQIGITLSKYGEADCYRKILLSLKETSKIEDVEVYWFNDEQKMLLKFSKLLRKINPDIVTGYNIFGFDWKYIRGRVKLLSSEMEANGKCQEAANFRNEFEKLSRIDKEISNWDENGKRLTSSALGNNELYFYDMKGRVQLDLMKIIQRDHKLSSYKLDNVASHFIRADIYSIKKDGKYYNISTNSTYGLSKNNYVSIVYFDGAIEEKIDAKFKIINLEEKNIYIETDMSFDEFMDFKDGAYVKKKGYKVSWTQAKDDISPAEIFKLYTQTPQDRAIVGKYCIQDCVLCNLLMAKLQIITSNVGMAMVCNTTLQWIFTRGQGIKILNLVSKKCRERNHLIPTVRKKPEKTEEQKKKDKEKVKIDSDSSDSDGEYFDDKYIEKHINNKERKGKDFIDSDSDEDGYEGAIVFPPKPKVHFQPIPVLDFASLYPNAMRMRNMSHECCVKDKLYDNLPDFKYHTITYKNNKGQLRTDKFAEKLDGSIKGIIPDILTDLLNARKKYKKIMENEEDSFKKNVLDGLQQAYKVTANSLYGQTGAATSAVKMKEIAASTTATGREMLQFSKYFIENMYSKLVNLMNDKDKYFEKAEEFYKYYPTNFKTKDIEGNNIDIHVNTLENEIIGDSKFIRRYIGYENKYSFDEFKDLCDWKSIDNKLYELSPMKRDKFIKNIKENDKYKIFDKEVYKNICKNEKIIDNLEKLVDELGYKNKTEFFEKFYLSFKNMVKKYNTDMKIIYGDTDSVFFNVNLYDIEKKEFITDEISLQLSIKIGIWASIMICTILPSPMAQEYEKVLWPFIIQGKKRYVGNLYEKDPKSFKQKVMGIELKRRDNAPIVKVVLAGVVDKILNKRDKVGAFEYIKTMLKNIIGKKFPLDKFVITKTLRGNALSRADRELERKKPKELRSYANRDSIVHAALADRIYDRSGERILSGERVLYCYIYKQEFDIKNNKVLQSHRVDDPHYVKENNIELDYLFYISNQIQQPVEKFLELICTNYRELFEDYIHMENNRKKNIQPLSFFEEKGEIDFDTKIVKQEFKLKKKK